MKKEIIILTLIVLLTLPLIYSQSSLEEFDSLDESEFLPDNIEGIPSPTDGIGDEPTLEIGNEMQLETTASFWTFLIIGIIIAAIIIGAIFFLMAKLKK